MINSDNPSPENMPPTDDRPFQFSLKVLFALPLWLAGAFAAGAWLGQSGAVLYVLLSLFLTGVLVRGLRWLAVVVIIVSCAGLLMPATSPPNGRRSSCVNNLKELALALHSYHAEYGSLPPAYVADEKGRPLYSWRVLILPYIDRQDIYWNWHLDEPWDSPNNIALSQLSLRVFCCPEEFRQIDEDVSGRTSYVAVVGADTIWPGAQSRRFKDVSDGLANTILLVEVYNAGIRWAEPRDLDIDRMTMKVNSSVGQGISSLHAGGANVAMADGSQKFLPSRTSFSTLRGLLTISGGEDMASGEQ